MARPASDIPERLLASARRHFLASGVDGSSLRAIAQDAGTSIGMIYYHYETKDELFRAVVEEVYEPLLGELLVMLEPERDVEARLHDALGRLGRMSEEELEVVRIIIREGMSHSERLRWIVERVTRGHLPLVFQLMSDGMSQGTLRSDMHPLVLLLATGSLGLFAQVMRRRLPEGGMPEAGAPDGAALAEALSEVLLHGIGARPAERTD
jgi:AcrR family transcriptional regulator